MKIPVGILGATGSVGQKFIQLLANHPWFEIAFLGASERSAGKTYKNAVNWFMTEPIPKQIAEVTVGNCTPGADCRVVFSGLDAGVAGEIEENFARAGYIVLSNSRNHRFDHDVPLLIPEVNADHLELINRQTYGKGCIVTNPNCSTIGLVMAIKPLVDHFGVELLNVVTLQALSGAGYPGVASLDIIDNIVPYIGSEEEKMETEPLKILGRIDNNSVKMLFRKIKTTCHRSRNHHSLARIRCAAPGTKPPLRPETPDLLLRTKQLSPTQTTPQYR
jgi:aspartate-semialdehyde dehydrogenase